MRRESSWTSVAVWLVLLAFAFACGALVIGQAFDRRVLALTGHSLRLSADYSADARLAREQKIAPVDSAVISDTVQASSTWRSRSMPSPPRNRPAPPLPSRNR